MMMDEGIKLYVIIVYCKYGDQVATFDSRPGHFYF